MAAKTILWLSEADVASLLTIHETMQAVERAFWLHGLGEVQLPRKIYLDFDPYGGDLRAMPAYIKGRQPAAGVKIVNSNAENPSRGLPAVSGVMVYNDPKTGLPLMLLAAGTLTALRTGAAGGVAARVLARPSSQSVGLVGCGKQAATQLAALRQAFKLRTVFVWGKTKIEIASFVDSIPDRKKLNVHLCSSVEQACKADIVVTTTPVCRPLVKAQWIRPGTHINAIGADAPGKQELDIALLLKARVVVDDWAQASHAGEINRAVSLGRFSRKNLVGQLGDIVAGKMRGRRTDQDITIFDSTGLAIQDVAVAQVIYNKALKHNKGKVLQFNG